MKRYDKYDLLTYIEHMIATYGRAPTTREMLAFFKVKSWNRLYDKLAALETEGYIKRDRYKERGIELKRTR